MHGDSENFGATLRRWRTARGWSQERLAEAAEVSTRHLSFLETGRSSPSREMTLVLGAALELSLRDRNALLGAAGFTAAYGEAPIDGPALAIVERALDHILRAHEPNGAIVVDRAWNIARMNQGAGALYAWCFDGRAPEPSIVGNALRVLFHPTGLRPLIVNFDEVASVTLERLRHEARANRDGALVELGRELTAYAPLPRVQTPTRPEGALPVLPVRLRRGDVELRLFTLVTTLGTPLDATAQELRIESYFPADDTTERFVRGLVSRGP